MARVRSTGLARFLAGIGIAQAALAIWFLVVVDGDMNAAERSIDGIVGAQPSQTAALRHGDGTLSRMRAAWPTPVRQIPATPGWRDSRRGEVEVDRLRDPFAPPLKRAPARPVVCRFGARQPI